MPERRLRLAVAPEAVASPAAAVALARVAERGRLDALVLPTAPARDALDLAAALAPLTKHIGLIAPAPRDAAPWDLARRLASLDHLSGGRAGWLAPAGDDARTDELVDVLRRVWDGSEDEAFVADRDRGVWADRARLHQPEHHGAHFDVAGILPFPRAPQGHPVIVSASARHADVVLAAPETLDAGAVLRRELRAPRLLARLPLDGTRSPDELSGRIGDWFAFGAADGFALVPETPEALAAFVADVVPRLQARGLHRADYDGTTLRDRLGLDRPVNRHVPSHA